MFDFFADLHAGLLDHFQAHPLIWWGALALAATVGGVLGYVSARHEQKTSGR
jgi:ABC-type proline/glycine betaine transport system permease subunit